MCTRCKFYTQKYAIKGLKIIHKNSGTCLCNIDDNCNLLYFYLKCTSPVI